MAEPTSKPINGATTICLPAGRAAAYLFLPRAHGPGLFRPLPFFSPRLRLLFCPSTPPFSIPSPHPETTANAVTILCAPETKSMRGLSIRGELPRLLFHDDNERACVGFSLGETRFSASGGISGDNAPPRTAGDTPVVSRFLPRAGDSNARGSKSEIDAVYRLTRG